MNAVQLALMVETAAGLQPMKVVMKITFTF